MTLIRYSMMVAVVCVLVFSTACDEDTISDPTKFYAEESFEFGFALAARTQLSLLAVNGTVEITGDPSAKGVIVTGVRRVGSSSVADAQSHLDSLSVEFDSSAVAVYVRTEQPTHADGRDYIVDYNVTLPGGFAVAAVGANGSVVLRSLSGGVRIAFANASINGTAIEGDTDVAVANGNIETSVTLSPGGRVVLDAANGQIRLKIPVDTSAEFDASTANGAISVLNLTLTDEVRTPTSVTGTLGSGNGEISIGVANGSIVVEGF